MKRITAFEAQERIAMVVANAFANIGVDEIIEDDSTPEITVKLNDGQVFNLQITKVR